MKETTLAKANKLSDAIKKEKSRHQTLESLVLNLKKKHYDPKVLKASVYVSMNSHTASLTGQDVIDFLEMKLAQRARRIKRLTEEFEAL